ncbi:hypothetical protein E2562_032182 [Oryza meyeriana var. granulata]|uniref:Uncharacterized protein n=1 Tax=Oryza meyeriana var. granulata TaxID=110450 RepID=A0A6G1F0B4_9ORYZ|nr:hypothetical protein E2562_032182 [Oryza meyeriana var. granulata]
MEVASLFRTPQPHHLAELRIEGADQSPVAFSDPCAVGRKRRCLFPAFSPRKRMLLELPPFSSAPPGPGCAAGVHSSVPPAKTGGSGGGGSLSFSAMPERILTPMGSSGGGAFAFLASPKQPLTPMGSTASSGGGGGSWFLAPEPSLSPNPTGYDGSGAFAFLASPSSVLRSPNDGGGFAFFGSPDPQRTAGDTNRSGVPFLAPPKPVSGPAGSPPSAAAKASAPAGSGVTGDGGLVAPPFRGRSLWSRRLAHAAAEGRTIQQLQITLPPQKVPKTVAPATGEPSRGGGATLSASTASPCCTFLTLPAKASNQEREMRASRVDGEGATTPAVAACTGGEMVVSVTCSCGAREEFCIDRRH